MTGPAGRCGTLVPAVAVVLACLHAVGVEPAAAVDTPPIPLAGNPAPAHPDPETLSDNQGIVDYRVVVDAKGNPATIEILGATPGSKGLDEAARKTLERWRFEPATAGGAPVAGEYTGSFAFLETLPTEAARMYPVNRTDAWDALVRTLRELRLPVDVQDQELGYVRTHMKRIQRRPGIAEQFEGAANRPENATVHAYLSPLATPPRLYVNTTSTGTREGERGEKLFFDLPGLGTWFYAEFERRLGAAGIPIPAREYFRLQASAPFDEAAARCVERDWGFERAVFDADTERPRVIAATKTTPAYQRTHLAGQDGSVIVQAVIQEDGRVGEVRALRVQGDPDFAESALGAVRQWRYRPARKNGCAIQLYFTVHVNFVSHR